MTASTKATWTDPRVLLQVIAWVANMGDVSAFWTRNSQQSDSPADQGGGGQWDALLTGTKSPWYKRTFINQ